jgi:hypothetical protein
MKCGIDLDVGFQRWDENIATDLPCMEICLKGYSFTLEYSIQLFHKKIKEKQKIVSLF